MIQVSIARIKRYAVIFGITGSAVALLTRGPKEGASFLVGAALALVTIESWTRLADSLNPQATPSAKRSALASAAFLALRYLLIAAAIYATVKVLGVSPVALLLGLLVAFAAVLFEIFQQVTRK